MLIFKSWKINWHRVNCVASRCSSFVDCSRNVFKHSNVSQRFLFIIERREDQSKANVNFHKKSFNIMALIKDVYLLKKAERREKGVCCMLVIFCNYQINLRSICFSFLFVFTNFLIHVSALAFTRKVALKAVRNIFFSLWRHCAHFLNRPLKRLFCKLCQTLPSLYSPSMMWSKKKSIWTLFLPDPDFKQFQWILQILRDKGKTLPNNASSAAAIFTPVFKTDLY